MDLSIRRLAVAGSLLLAACARLPNGPTVLVLPGRGKDFAQFASDDQTCRQWAAQQTGTTTKQTADEATTSGAAVGTAEATGGAVAAGADSGDDAETIVQRRYDVAYMQCMYASGNQIPVPRGLEYRGAHTDGGGADVPPPPPGRPPPPPPR